MSNLLKRVLFAVVAIPIVGVAIWFGDAPLAILLSIVSALAAWEYVRLAQATGAKPMMEWTVILAALIPLAVHAARLGYGIPRLSMVALLVPVLLTTALWTRGSEGKPLGAVAATLFGAWYAGGLLAFVYGLRYHRFAVGALAGTILVALPLVLTWLNDSGAFVFGKRFGKKKLMPSVSPGKTWAGAIGALGVTIVSTWVLMRYVVGPNTGLGLSIWGVIVFGAAISIAAQVGDLAESLLKREAGVKDSSTLIPGHGGVLDRTDSLLFTVPVAYVLIDLLVWFRA